MANEVGEAERVAPLEVTQVDACGATIVDHRSIERAPTLASSPTTGTLGPKEHRSTVLPKVRTEPGGTSLVYDDAPRYEELGALGEGGYGEVVKVRDNDIGRVVAMKRLKVDRHGQAPLARFVEEIRTIGRLDHPNIVPIHDVGVDDHGHHYFVMKHVEGQTLEAIITKLSEGDREYHRRFTFEYRTQVFRKLLEAVSFAHAAGYVHRDIKPANVMVGAFGEVMLMDWGVAKRIGAPDAPADSAEAPSSKVATRAGTLIGTPAYMSPEQARGEVDVDERSDVYALSVLFWEFLALRHPHAERKTLEELLKAVTLEPIPSPSFGERCPHQSPVPIDLSWFVRRGLEKDREKRYANVLEMRDRLERRMDGDIPIQCPVTLAKTVTNRWTRFVDRHPLIVTLLVVASVLALPTSFVLLLIRR